MKNKIIGGLLLPMGALIFFIPRYIFPTCYYHGFHLMACSYMGTAEMAVGFIIMAVACGMLLSKSDEALRWLSLTALATGITVLVLPDAIGYCHSSDMPCNYATVPALQLFGSIVLLLSLTGMAISFRKDHSRNFIKNEDEREHTETMKKLKRQE